MKSPATILLLILVVFWGCTESKKQEVADSLHFSLKDSVLENPIALIYAEGSYQLFFDCTVDGQKKCGLAESKDLVNWSNKPTKFESEEAGNQNIKTVVKDWNQTTEYSVDVSALIAFATVADQPGKLTVLYSANDGSTWQQDTENTVVLTDFYEPVQDLKVF
jgi:fructan beta-fructosidase